MKPGLRTVRVVFPMLLLTAAVSVQAQHGRRYGYYPRVQAAVSIATPFLQLNWGGSPYYYSSGAFYRPYGGNYRMVPPPFGIHVNILPRGYFPIYTGDYPYYYYNGIFYQRSRMQQQEDYEVVQAPMGAEVPSLPSDARTMIIDGEKFYSVNGTYFKDAIHPNGEVWYRVVGKHGVLNTDKNNDNYQQPAPQYQYPQQQYPQQYPQQSYPPQPRYPVRDQDDAAEPAPMPAPRQQQAAPQRQQQYPQVAPQPQYPVQDDAVAPAPAPRQPAAPQQESRPASPKAIMVPRGDQESLPPAQNGSREASRRLPGQTAGSQGEVKSGEADSTDEEEVMEEGGAPDLIVHDNPNVGWVVDKLPANCKTVTIKNKKYFVAPNGIYYEEYIDGRQVRYKVAGKEVNRD